jgi:CheY-like chemotaxis protein
VVDDEAAWQTILSTDLRMLGYRVLVAGDADEAIARATEGAEVAIIDLMLPEPIDGRALLGMFRERGLAFPIIFYTAYPVFPQEDDDPGIAGYLSKSVDRADLYALIPPAVLRHRNRKGRR